nr:hypothetical protein [Cnaphalocrocis medinalis granulovirus]
MHEDILVLLKSYNNKYNKLDDAYHELRQQYDITQYELRCVKKILQEICTTVAPHRLQYIQHLLDTHDKNYKMLYEERNTNIPLAQIRFKNNLTVDQNGKSMYVWDVL